MRSKFDEQLDLLNKELITMGAFCENAIELSANALTEGKPELADTVFHLSAQIDEKEREIENRCLIIVTAAACGKGFTNCVICIKNGNGYGTNWRPIG